MKEPRPTDRFVEPLMMRDKLLVLLPGRDEIVRDGMENLAVDLRLFKKSSESDYMRHCQQR